MALKDIVTTGDKKTGGWLSLIIGLIVIIVIVIVLWKIYTAVKTGANAFGDTLTDVTLSQTFGVDAARVIVCRTAATDCDNAVSRVYFFGTIIKVDNTSIINALNKLTTDAEVKLTCVFYKQKCGESLKDLIDSWHFTTTEANRITLLGSLV